MARMSKKTNGNGNPPTTAQQLGSLIKSARDIMRKDKGLSGDLDRLPMLTWVMFLKFLDDMEQIEESRAKLRKEKYRSSIEAPYRWRDWAAAENGVTGPELLAFINHEECVRPDGKKGPGLFAYLRGLQGNGTGRRQVIATVFGGVINRMTSGYLLRDVINKVSGIHFLAKEELFTLGHLYESMLKEMRDAAGDSGEFYTPRAVVRFMVEVLDPKLGETILDPACGTGGFLVETYAHLEKQCKTVQDRKILQEKSIFGGEAKPLPYLLAQMNLLLHGLEAPRIDSGNSLRFSLNEIGDRDRVDVILTNPPFGGEEERGILSNFPEDKQTAETALLFLQLIMRKLRRAPKPGRAGVVVPNGVLSASGVAMRIRQDLLQRFNLHTVVRLPQNVFAPYTDVATNLLFFDHSGATKDILFCEVPLPPGVTLSKTKPLDYLLLEPFLSVVRKRHDSPQSWFVRAADLNDQFDLDLKNPKGSLAELPSARVCLTTLMTTLGDLERKVAAVRNRVAGVTAAMKHVRAVSLRELTEECEERIGDDYDSSVRLVGVTNTDGITVPKTPIGKTPSKYKRVRIGNLVYNPMRINIGSIGVALTDNQIGITSPDYVVFRCTNGLRPEYAWQFLRSEAGRNAIRQKTRGSVRYRLYYDKLATIEIPLPKAEATQEEFIELCRDMMQLAAGFDNGHQWSTDCLAAILRELFVGVK